MNKNTKNAIEYFRQELLREIDEFANMRLTTMEEARGADVATQIVRLLEVAMCEYCNKPLRIVDGKLPDHLCQTGHQCPNVGQDANHQTRDNWP